MSRKPTNANNVSLAGEFAVLSKLALNDYDANMTLGNTKGVDILCSKDKKLYKLEVKTHLDRRKTDKNAKSELFGETVGTWIMKKKHENLRDGKLWYCFVSIPDPKVGSKTKSPRFFIVPSKTVAAYVKAEHALWRASPGEHKDTEMRIFRIGTRDGKYRIKTPGDVFEDNWEFLPHGRRRASIPTK
ncbi:MAG: hypothetical protein KGM24_03325 [Elusimicrobia bacterium]|nr:hypothetical protein [Elusimicrobiota bacterium]